ncbi:MAG: hypothetical protein IK092_01400, partial [Muribaculaceae bacterium]|nr:hypothetical protein [Muribaculaceae bacterium]
PQCDITTAHLRRAALGGPPLSHSAVHSFAVNGTMCFAQLQVSRLATASLKPSPYLPILC